MPPDYAPLSFYKFEPNTFILRVGVGISSVFEKGSGVAQTTFSQTLPGKYFWLISNYIMIQKIHSFSYDFGYMSLRVSYFLSGYWRLFRIKPKLRWRNLVNGEIDNNKEIKTSCYFQPVQKSFFQIYLFIKWINIVYSLNIYLDHIKLTYYWATKNLAK